MPLTKVKGAVWDAADNPDIPTPSNVGSPKYTELGSAAFIDVENVPVNVFPLAKSSAYAVTANDNGKTIVVTGTTTITLPAASDVYSASKSFAVTIKAVAGATVTVARSGSDTIETVAGNKSITANTALTFFPTSSTAWETI